MEGGPDPDCRRGYPEVADEEGLAMRAFVRAVVHARQDHVALRRGHSARRRRERTGDRARSRGRRGARPGRG